MERLTGLVEQGRPSGKTDWSGGAGPTQLGQSAGGAATRGGTERVKVWNAAVQLSGACGRGRGGERGAI